MMMVMVIGRRRWKKMMMCMMIVIVGQNLTLLDFCLICVIDFQPREKERKKSFVEGKERRKEENEEQIKKWEKKEDTQLNTKLICDSRFLRCTFDIYFESKITNGGKIGKRDSRCMGFRRYTFAFDAGTHNKGGRQG